MTVALPQRFGAFIAPYHDRRQPDPAAPPRPRAGRAARPARLRRGRGSASTTAAPTRSIASPELMIAAAAERTKRIRLGTGVNSLALPPPVRPRRPHRAARPPDRWAGRCSASGPGQLPSDAFMMGIDPLRQRDMMIEAAEVIVPLLRGEVVSREDRLVQLDEARLQLRPLLPDGIEVAVASTSSPTGATLAGRLGLSMLSLAATDPSGFDALDANWAALRANLPASTATRSTARRWRVVASMHLAETREQAEREMEHGVLALCGYFEGMGKTQAALDRLGPRRRALVDDERLPDLRRRDRRHARRRHRHDRAAGGQDRRLRHVPVPRPQLRRLGRRRSAPTSCSPST